MNNFDKRKQSIIDAIAKSKGYITGRTLSMLLNLSLRTVQSEIASINRELPLIDSCNRGYTINQTVYRKLEQHVPVCDITDEHAILRRLLFSTSPCQIDELAESFYISTTTLEKKLKNYAPVLREYNLNISRKHSHIQIIGDELGKRKLINFLIFEETTPVFNSINNLIACFPDIDVEKIRLIILNAINKYHYYVDTSYLNNILVNVVIALSRMHSNYYVKNDSNSPAKIDSVEYKIASEICERYSSHYYLTPSKDDIYYISTLLEGQIKPQDNDNFVPALPDVLTPKFISEIHDILMSVFNYYMLDIDYSDRIYTFALHVNEMLKRAHNSLPAGNELAATIKKNCPFIYDVSVFIAEKIAEKYQVKIADSEIGYISFHIGFLIEAATKNTNKIVVLLFCDDYHRINETIEKKLVENFSGLIEVNIFHAGNRKSLIDIPSDLIITTKPLNIIWKKVLVISPFYTMIDHMNIDNAIHSCIKEKEKSHRNQLLASFFHENLFFKSNAFHTKEEVIRFLGQKAIDFGLTEDGFTESVLKRESLSSTCFFDTFAIPHAMNMDAKKTMFCVLISEKGISWDDHNIHIALLIAVSQQDRNRFMELYNGIIRTLENPQNVKCLVASKTYIDFIHCLIRLDYTQ